MECDEVVELVREIVSNNAIITGNELREILKCIYETSDAYRVLREVLGIMEIDI